MQKTLVIILVAISIVHAQFLEKTFMSDDKLCRGGNPIEEKCTKACDKFVKTIPSPMLNAQCKLKDGKKMCECSHRQ
jgi:hypothetical protein